MTLEAANTVPVDVPAVLETDYAELWLKQHFDPEEKTFTVVEEPTTGRDGSRNRGFQWGFGPLQIKGTANAQTLSVSFQAGVQVPFYGFVSLGSITGSLKNGATLSVNVFVAKGTIRVYLKGDQVWVQAKLTSPVFDTIQGDWKILTLCEYRV